MVSFFTQLLSWCSLFIFYAALLYLLGLVVIFAVRVKHARRFELTPGLRIIAFFALVYLLTVITWFFR